ncbi:dihydrolipoamide acetyltransferase family protein [Streptomyces qinglanensis]|uniref:Dihydrolipoamide acetyltransferase component of pyruvate dehydrogenase complex n=1 Tax=Streptomyces qinglanensis TaxID=943816 RepID=A0A1H9PUP1_9ACTN|nr:dihydrolipoamide acetyltransferase family protein [Streptomyces qinglanensis]SER52006.1 pyruvate dehydrogenase E2 component (dihydrolipoamide acetyltransferase) [Streptomyces qinglanensis]
MGEVREFALPDLGEGLTEATIVRWLVPVGDTVRVDEPVVEVETAKALVEVPCPFAGVVTSHAADEGAEVAVGAPLVTVAVSPDDGVSRPGGGGSAGAPDERGGPGSGADRAGEAEHVGGSGNVLVGYGTAQAPARRPRAALRLSGLSGPAGTGAPDAHPGGPGAGAGEESRSGADRGAPARGADRTAPEHPAGGGPAAAGPVPVISPLVRRLAREHGLDLRAMTGSGPDGLILRADVERAVHAAPQVPPPETPAPDGTGQPGGLRAAAARRERRIPLRGRRGTAADRLARSRAEIPDASCWVDADATELLAARKEMNAAADSVPAAPPISLLALLGRLCTAALARFPELNSTVDTEAREIVVLPEVHLGFAAQTDRGLVVPVVRDAHTLSAEQLTAELARLTEAARAGTLTPGELTGGTFTLNNYGVFGVDGSTPIINHPEAAMLGVGRIARKPWVVGDALAVRSVVQLSLTFDHRVCDGGTAGGFLRHVADCVERPARLLRTL